MEPKRIGVHLGTSGGCWKVVERAVEAGANTFQIFSSSPRMWKANPVKPQDAAKMRELRALHDVGPVSIHASYLINLCSQTESVRANGIAAFRGEVERALALGAEFLVLHPGSWKGLTREEGLRLAVVGIERALEGLPWPGVNFRILIENTAGAEFSLGSSLEQVAELVSRLKACAPIGVCLDTCHLHVAGYDIVTPEGYAETTQLIGETMGLRRYGCGTATMPRQRGAQSWTGTSILEKERLEQQSFGGCCGMGDLHKASLLPRRRSMWRVMWECSERSRDDFIGGGLLVVPMIKRR